jgi:hypothetical protein
VLPILKECRLTRRPLEGRPRVLLLPLLVVVVGLIVNAYALTHSSRTGSTWLAMIGGIIGAMAIIAVGGSVVSRRTVQRESEILRRRPGSLLVPIVTKTSLAVAARDLGMRSRIIPGVSATMAIDQSSTVRFFMGASRPRAVIVLRRERVMAVRPGLLQDGARIYRVIELVAQGPTGEVVVPMIVIRRGDLLSRALPELAVENLVEDVRKILFD